MKRLNQIIRRIPVLTKKRKQNKLDESVLTKIQPVEKRDCSKNCFPESWFAEIEQCKICRKKF